MLDVDMVGVGASGHWEIDGILTVTSDKRSKLPMSAKVRAMLGIYTCMVVWVFCIVGSSAAARVARV